MAAGLWMIFSTLFFSYAVLRKCFRKESKIENLKAVKEGGFRALFAWNQPHGD